MKMSTSVEEEEVVVVVACKLYSVDGSITSTLMSTGSPTIFLKLPKPDNGEKAMEQEKTEAFRASSEH